MTVAKSKKVQEVVLEMVGSQELILNFLPPTLNDQINLARTHWSKSASTKKKLTSRIASLASELEPIKGVVWLEFHWHVKTFARDSDNISAASKYILDGLVEAKILSNDNLTVIQSPVIHCYHKADSDYVVLFLHTNPLPLVIHFLKSFSNIISIIKMKVAIIKNL